MDYLRALLWRLFYKISPRQRLRLKKILQRDGHKKSVFSALIARRNAEGKERFDRAVMVLLNDLTWLDSEKKFDEVMEVGVGYVGTSLIGLGLYFDARVTGVDKNRIMDTGATRRAILAAPNFTTISSSLCLSPSQDVNFARLSKLNSSNDLELWMSANNISYVAPFDMAEHATHNIKKYDLVYSRSVLEHIAPSAYRTFVASIRQLASSSGYSIHFIDLTDHLSHKDDPRLFTHDISYDAERDSGWRGNALTPLEILKPFDEYFDVVHFCLGSSLDDQSLTEKKRFTTHLHAGEVGESSQWIFIEARVSAS